jgi:predicted thioesterase
MANEPNRAAASLEALGKTAAVTAAVAENDTAKAVGSGSLDVFATPMMIALMERAACECLADCLEPGQTSVGTEIHVSHTAASPVGAKITATAAIECVSGRRVEFKVTASDGAGEIGNGRHTRVVVDAEKFAGKSKNRAQESRPADG